MESNNQTKTEGALRNKFDGSIALLIAGALYLLIYSIVLIGFNGFTSLLTEGFYLLIFLVPAFIAAVLGLIAAYQLNQSKAGTGIIIGFASAGLGFVATLAVFLIGFEINGIIGPAWIIFALAAYWLYRNKRQTAS